MPVCVVNDGYNFFADRVKAITIEWGKCT